MGPASFWGWEWGWEGPALPLPTSSAVGSVLRLHGLGRLDKGSRPCGDPLPGPRGRVEGKEVEEAVGENDDLVEDEEGGEGVKREREKRGPGRSSGSRSDSRSA